MNLEVMNGANAKYTKTSVPFYKKTLIADTNTDNSIQYTFLGTFSNGHTPLLQNIALPINFKLKKHHESADNSEYLGATN